MFKGLFGARSETGFKTRSPERDQETDKETIGRVAEAIDNALSRPSNRFDAHRGSFTHQLRQACIDRGRDRPQCGLGRALGAVGGSRKEMPSLRLSSLPLPATRCCESQ